MMDKHFHLSRYSLLLLSSALLVLAACGKGYTNRSATTAAAADAYLMAPAGGMNANARALTTTATLSAGSAVIGAGSAVSTASSITTNLYSPQTVTLSCTDAAGNPCLATYYTVDGTTPNRGSTIYSGPILLWSKTTVKYFSIDKAGNVEPVKTQNFLIASIEIKDIKLIASGWNHTLGIKKDGTLWAWGGNTFGQLGAAGGADQAKPVQVGVDTDWSAISAGKSYSLALKTNGTLWAWGLNAKGQLGDATNADKATPVQIGVAANWSAISAGDSFAMALKADGTLWTWGANNKGQLGVGTLVDSNIPAQVGTVATWTAVAAGYDHAVGLRNDGTIWTWGGNEAGQLAQNNTINSAIPLQVPGNNWTAIAAGGSDMPYYRNVGGVDVLRVGGHTVALKGDGTMWSWGCNTFGQLGDGTNYNMVWAGAGTYPFTGNEANDRFLPYQIGTDTDWAKISSGAAHVVALKTDSTLWAWGLNVNGQLANGNPGMNNVQPLPVGADSYLPYILPKQPWSLIAAGGYQTLALRGDGTVWSWGWNGSGQLGDGSKISTGGGSAPTKATWRLPKYSYVLSNKIYSYTIDYDIGSGSGPGTGSGQLTPTGLPATVAGSSPVGMASDAANKFLYVIDGKVSTVEGEQVSYIYCYTIDRVTGGLTQVGAPVKTLYSPTEVKVDPLGKFVYVVGMHSKGYRAVAVYTINPATGEITCVGTGGKGATTIEIEPLGKYAYILRDNKAATSLGIVGYSIDQRTGMLSTLVEPCLYDFCDDNEDTAEIYVTGGQYLKTDLSGQFLYLARTSPTEIRVYHINPASGRIYDMKGPQALPAISKMVISPAARSTVTGLPGNAHTQFMYLLYQIPYQQTTLQEFDLPQLTGFIYGNGKEAAPGGLGVAAEQTGKLVYVYMAGYVYGYAKDPVNGTTQVIGPQTTSVNAGVTTITTTPTKMATDAGAGGQIVSMLITAY